MSDTFRESLEKQDEVFTEIALVIEQTIKEEKIEQFKDYLQELLLRIYGEQISPLLGMTNLTLEREGLTWTHRGRAVTIKDELRRMAPLMIRHHMETHGREEEVVPTGVDCLIDRIFWGYKSSACPDDALFSVNAIRLLKEILVFTDSVEVLLNWQPRKIDA